MSILVTGTAGYIGFHVAKRLIARGERVVGLDNVNTYYDIRLKEARIRQLEGLPEYSFRRLELSDRKGMETLFREQKPKTVIHLAAQAGVRYSLENPHAYMDSNLVGFMNILEGCRHHGIQHLVYASSSSVYGSNTQMPFSVDQSVDHPVSLYAATKRANELMAHTYSHLFKLPTTGLRFFTVYGPWGRPDMALFLFTKDILEGRPIDVLNHGKMRRDFTYIDDIVEGIVRTHDHTAQPAIGDDAQRPGRSSAPYRVYNIGNHTPVELLRLIELLETNLGKSAVKNFMPMQAGDVPATWADVEDLSHDTGFQPSTPIEVGVQRFVSWYREFYKV